MRDRVRHLTKGVAIYGTGDAAVQVVNFLLLAVYVKGGFLRETDYGALAIIIAIETFWKVVSRWGLDGAFMRFYHDRAGGRPLEQLASTIVWFMLVIDAVLLSLALVFSRSLGAYWFDDAGYITALRLMLVNTFLISFTFLPFHVMRLRNEAVTYSAFTFARSVGTLVLRIALVIGLRMGVTGMFLADVIVTLVILPFLWPWFRLLVRPLFSLQDLGGVLRFGLPRLPHGLALQALDAGNKLLLERYIPLRQLGVYQNGVTLGSASKFFTAAFETAWAPFYYATSREPDAKVVFQKMTTYGVALLALLAALATVVARDLILVMLEPEYLPAARVIPFVAVAMACQGVYLLTSIGLNLTSRTAYYPVATFAAAGVGLGSGFWLMPRYGMTGAAIAFLLSYATQAATAFVLAQRFYPIRYETGRIVRVAGAALTAVIVGAWVVPPMPPLAALLLRSLAAAASYLSFLWLTGFLRATERAFIRETMVRWRRQKAAPPVT